MRPLQRGVAASVVVASMSIAGAGAAPAEDPITGFCCPGGDHGLELQATGLGQSQPSATDLSSDPLWRVYGFQRDGVAYFQVNDLAGRVQLIIGSVDGLFWVLPAGEMRSQVVVPPQRMRAPQTVVRAEVYRHPEFTLVRYGADDSTVWSVEVPEG